MDFDYPASTLALRQRLDEFMARYLLPYNGAWHQSVAQGIYPPPFMQDLKDLAKSEGLWSGPQNP